MKKSFTFNYGVIGSFTELILMVFIRFSIYLLITMQQIVLLPFMLCTISRFVFLFFYICFCWHFSNQQIKSLSLFCVFLLFNHSESFQDISKMAS